MSVSNYRQRRNRREPQPGGPGGRYLGAYCFEVAEMNQMAGFVELRQVTIDSATYQTLPINDLEVGRIIPLPAGAVVVFDGNPHPTAEMEVTTVSNWRIAAPGIFTTFDLYIEPARRELNTGTGLINSAQYLRGGY